MSGLEPAERDAQRAGERDPRAAPSTTSAPSSALPAVARALQLQRGAGNQAAARALSRAPTASPAPTIGPTPTTTTPVPPAIATACETINTALRTGGQLQTILLELDRNRDHGAALIDAYRSLYDGDLELQLRLHFSEADCARARDYLHFGGLRTMTKVLIALAGAGTDKPTLLRVLADAATQYPDAAAIEAAWGEVAHDPENPLASGFAKDSLDEALDDDLDGADLVRARATIGRKGGKLEPVDKIYLAMDQWGTDEALLFEGLAAADPDKIATQFEHYPFRDPLTMGLNGTLLDALDSELSGAELDHALTLIGYERNPDSGWLSSEPKFRKRQGPAESRLLLLVRVAVSSWNTDEDLIWSSIKQAPEADRRALLAKLNDPADPDCATIKKELNAGELTRLRAMLQDPTVAEPGDGQWAGAGGAPTQGAAGTGTTPGAPGAPPATNPASTDDRAVLELEARGGVDRDSVFDTIKLSSGQALDDFRRAWLDTASAFHQYVEERTTAIQQGELYTILSTDLKQRILWCFQLVDDDEDYLFHLLGKVATDAERRAVAADTALMDRMRSALSTTEMRRAESLLVPGDATPDETLAALGKQVTDETGGIADLFTGTGDAVRDEYRDLVVDTEAARAQGGNVDPTLQSRLRADADRTSQALADYKQARDEFVGEIDLIVSTAIGIAATAITGGAAVPIVASQLARVALAMAVTKVLTQKALKGDAFDIAGGDGLRAAIDGAFEGCLMMKGAFVARGIAVEFGAAEQATRELTERTFSAVVKRTAESALEGGRDSALSAIVSASTDDQTWKNGLLPAVETMTTSAATAFGQGALMSGGTHLGGEAWGAGRDYFRGRGDAQSGGAPGAAPQVDDSGAAAMANPEQPTVALPSGAPVSSSARTPAEWTAMREALGDLATRVPIVENRQLEGAGVRVRYGDADGVRLEIGPHATATQIAQHAAVARMLVRYEGPIGQLRRLYDYVRSLYTGDPAYGTVGFESRAEVVKLREIMADLEARQTSLRQRIDAAGGPDGASARDLEGLDHELASLQEQLDAHQANVDSYASGRGFIAAEGSRLSAAPKDWPITAVTPQKVAGVGWVTGIDKPMKAGRVYEFPGGERVWAQQDGGIVIENRLRDSTSRLGDEKELPSRGEYADPGYREALYELAHSQGTGVGAQVPGVGVYLAPEVVNQRLQRWGVEEFLYRVRDDFELPAGWEVDVITVTKPETGTMRLASIEYRVDVTRPGKSGGPPTRTQALNIDITVDTTDVGTVGRPKVAVDAEWTFHARADDELRALVEGVDMTGAESAIQKALEKGKLWDDVQFTGGSGGGK